MCRLVHKENCQEVMSHPSSNALLKELRVWFILLLSRRLPIPAGDLWEIRPTMVLTMATNLHVASL